MTFKKIIFVILVRLYSLFRGKANTKPKKIEKILVVHMAKLGDMVCTTPVLRAIKEKYKTSTLTVMGDSINRSVLLHNDDVDEYLVFSSIKNTLKQIRKNKYDVAILVGSPDKTSLMICFLANIPFIIGPRVVGDKSPFYDIWYRLMEKLIYLVDHRMHTYGPGEYLKLLEPIDIYSKNIEKKLGFSEEARLEAETFFKGFENSLLVGISPSAGNKLKNWGGHKFAELAKMLSDKFDARIIVFGGPRDKGEVGEMLSALSSDIKYIDLSMKLSIDTLKACISRLDLFVAVDTGPIYIAEAFQIPTVDIVGPVDEREQPPRGENHLVVIPPPPRTPQLFLMNRHNYDFAELKRQIDSTSVQMVFDACAKIINKARQ